MLYWVSGLMWHQDLSCRDVFSVFFFPQFSYASDPHHTNTHKSTLVALQSSGNNGFGVRADFWWDVEERKVCEGERDREGRSEESRKQGADRDGERENKNGECLL